jgi:hypothetical protein
MDDAEDTTSSMGQASQGCTMSYEYDMGGKGENGINLLGTELVRGISL